MLPRKPTKITTRKRSVRKVAIPQFAYPGGKAKLAERIVALLPPAGERFVEPFAGRANVYFAVTQLLNYKKFWLNDTQTYRFFIALWSHGARHSMGIGRVPERNGRTTHDFMKNYTMEVFLESWVRYNPPRKQMLRQVWKQRPDLLKWARENLASPAPVYEPYLVRSGSRYGKAGVRGEVGGGVTRAGYERNLLLASDIMMRTCPRITWVDYREVLKECGPTDVVYLDPPYKNYGRKTGAYSETLNYEELVQILLDAPFRWVLSEYEDKVYKPLTERFGEPVRIEVRKTMNASKDHGGKRPKAHECIWKNF